MTGAPEAAAMPRESGSATRKTTSDAGRSARSPWNSDWRTGGRSGESEGACVGGESDVETGFGDEIGMVVLG
jgi:hypothetical protein